MSCAPAAVSISAAVIDISFRSASSFSPNAQLIFNTGIPHASTFSLSSSTKLLWFGKHSPKPPKMNRLRGRFRGAGTEAEVTMDLGADGNASTLRASVTSAGDRGLTLRGLLSLLGITDPPIAAPDGGACDPLLDVVIDAVDASFDVSGRSLALVEFTATVRSPGARAHRRRTP